MPYFKFIEMEFIEGTDLGDKQRIVGGCCKIAISLTTEWSVISEIAC
jgi:hypothetical protein